MGRRCETCRWWGGVGRGGRGRCRRFPPLPAGGHYGEVAKWAGTHPDDNCGEWAAKEDPDGS